MADGEKQFGYCKAVIMKPSAIFGYVVIDDGLVTITTNNDDVISVPEDQLMLLEGATYIKSENIGDTNHETKRKAKGEH